MGLAGKSVIVTGGASGIGQAAALILGEAGCAVTIGDIDEQGGTETARRINEMSGAEARFIWTDVAAESSVESMIEAAASSFGRLDGAINSAGIMESSKLVHELTLEDWDRCGAVNLRGTFLCLRAEINAMLDKNAGSIVVISSIAANHGYTRMAEYCASKAGAMGLVRSAAIDYVTRGIRVNAILPSGTATPMVELSIKKDPKVLEMIAATPMQRLAQPREVAAAAVWLISDQASYVTGASFAIDGGTSIKRP